MLSTASIFTSKVVLFFQIIQAGGLRRQIGRSPGKEEACKKEAYEISFFYKHNSL